MKEQQEGGIDVKHYLVDITNKQALSEVFKIIGISGYPLKGIFHLAGLLHDGLLINLSTDDFNVVLAPKILGTQNLDILSRNEALDCFVLFSSIAALLGNPGQANYAAANAFMDGVAQARRQEGLPALSINWGPFASSGMAAHLANQHNAQGMIPLETQSAFQVMDSLLQEATAQAGVMLMDWSKVTRSADPFLSHLIGDTKTKEGEWLLLLEATPAVQREAVLINLLKQLLGGILHIQDTSQVDSARGFFEMGMDSLMAVDLKNRLQALTGKILPNTLVFDFPNITDLFNYLAVNVFPTLFTELKSIVKEDSEETRLGKFLDMEVSEIDKFIAGEETNE